MARVHGKSTVIIFNGVDISTHCNSSENTREADEHDLTTYGKDAHVFGGGLKGGKQSISGLYDSAAGTGPRAVIRPTIGTVVPFIRRPEGTGSGKPQDSVQVHVKSYVETSPVADYVAWSAELTLSDNVDSTPQP